ncbi:MAG TPA: hypothetical protein VN966_01240 [Candidatus Bathyarchaeia archaeon]|nr:hypothetical protein [Candidatus Bathyarchaeia archaeon]
MTGSEAAKRQMRKLFPASLNRTKCDGAFKPAADVAIVRLIDSPLRLPVTPIEQRLLATLKASPVSFEKVVQLVAADLYKEELNKGAGVLDIGLFGGRLFNNDIVRELKAADGILWEIYQEPESA